MNRRILLGVSILVVFIFLLQPVASVNVSNFESTKPIERVSEIQDEIERPSEAVEEPEIKEESAETNSVQITPQSEDIKQWIKPMKPFEEQMEENRQIMREAIPNIPVPRLDYDRAIRNINEVENTKESDLPLEVSFMEDHRLYFDEDELERYEFMMAQKETQSASKTRAGEADLRISQIEWDESFNDAWTHLSEVPDADEPGTNPTIGGFMVGKETTIKYTITNSNPTVPVTGEHLNVSIWDYYGNVPLIKEPTPVEFSIVGGTQVVEFKFTPLAAKYLYIAGYIDYDDDADHTNNFKVFQYLVPVLLFASDLETGDTTAWTGDEGTGNNEWHKQTSAENQASQAHSTATSYHHGTENFPSQDTYSDDATTDGVIELLSPKLDLGDIDANGQSVAGILPNDYYYPFTVPKWAGLFTGEAEVDATQPDETNTELLWNCYCADDATGTLNWKSRLNPVGNRGYLIGNWETPYGLTSTTLWNPSYHLIGNTLYPGWPMALNVGDGSGGVQPSNSLTNWSHVTFKAMFDGDEQSDTGGLPGWYADDFIIWGYQSWLPPYSIRLEIPTNPVAGGEHIYYPNVEVSFDTTIENLGDELSNVPIKIQIYDAPREQTGAKSVHGPQTQTVSSLPVDGEAEVNWKWKPTSVGQYYVYIEAGDLNQDYTNYLNTHDLKIIVTNPNGRVLIVDDDNGIHNAGIYYKNTEEPMMQSLDELGISYNVFNVGRNDTGPSMAIMNNYEAVIWMTGLDNEHTNYGQNPNWASNWAITLKPEDQTTITNFVSQGDKNLWVISPGVLYDLTDSNNAQQPSGFLKDYLHVTYCNANETTYKTGGDIDNRGTPPVLIGHSSSLAAEANYNTYVDKPVTGFMDIGSIIDKDSDSIPVFYQNTARTSYNSLQYSKDYRLVYFGFNYYLIDSASDRKDLTYRVMNFFGLVGGVTVDLDTGEQQDRETKFGQTLSYKFEVANLGLMKETMNVKLVNPTPSKIPKGWTVKLNGKAPTDPLNEIVVAGLGTKPIYLNVTAPTTYLDSTGAMDSTLENITAGSQIHFKIRVESKNYPDNFYDFAGCKVKIELVGYI
ncbi:MAG: hypothetical protein JSV49_11470 [Thermoplasmata archaeon]|nr:MAG: hypothetical protein JSV49_11470 [Thermoplasmata archaeon]